MRLATRTVVLSLGLAVLPLVSTAYFLLYESRQALQREALNRMDGLVEKKSMQVRQYLAERLQDVRLIARSHEVVWATQYLEHQYRAGGAEVLTMQPAANICATISGAMWKRVACCMTCCSSILGAR